MILNIPHSSSSIPAKYRDQIILSDEELEEELLLMTDAYTDELFSYKNAKKIVFPISRILVNPERFKDDEKEKAYEPEEEIDVETAIRYHTLGGAYQNFLENTTGSIEKGKKADLVLLNQNIFAEDSNRLYETKVEMTIFDGKVIYSK